MDSSITRHGEEINEIIDKQEYAENQDRRNNLKIFGIPESRGQESWVDSENLVKANIKEILCIEEDIEIERAHQVGQKREFFTRKDGTKVKAVPRPIVAKLTSWKQKEKVVCTARKLKPEKVKVLNDFCKRTLEKRAAQRDRLLEERKKGNAAYFVGSRLVVYKKSNNDRPPGGRPPSANDNTSQEGDGEILFKG